MDSNQRRVYIRSHKTKTHIEFVTTMFDLVITVLWSCEFWVVALSAIVAFALYRILDSNGYPAEVAIIVGVVVFWVVSQLVVYQFHIASGWESYLKAHSYSVDIQATRWYNSWAFLCYNAFKTFSKKMLRGRYAERIEWGETASGRGWMRGDGSQNRHWRSGRGYPVQQTQWRCSWW